MSRFVSPQKRLANRQNARKSTGPKSPGGKLASSRNAIKHGLLAKDVVITGSKCSESQAHFDALFAGLVQELQPQGLVEQTLVERIATCYWRLHRVQRFEKGAIREALESPVEDDGTLRYFRQRLPHEEQRLADIERLAQLFATPLESLSQSDKQELVKLVEKVPLPYPRPLIDIFPPFEPKNLRDNLPSMRTEQAAKVQETREGIKNAEEQARLSNARKAMTGSLPDDTSLLKLIRFESMLDRQIHRALAELRRLRKQNQKDEA